MNSEKTNLQAISTTVRESETPFLPDTLAGLHGFKDSVSKESIPNRARFFGSSVLTVFENAKAFWISRQGKSKVEG